MDGYELAEKAKRVREGLKVIALSGREQDASGLPLIRKPFLTQDLKAVMAQHRALLSLAGTTTLGASLRFSGFYRAVGYHTVIAGLCGAIGDCEAFGAQSTPK
jgi:hypothetical protein